MKKPRIPALFGRPLAAAAGVVLAALLTGPAAVPSVQAQTLPLWEIGRDGRIGYVLGTLHVGQPEFYPLPPPMREAFSWAEVIAIELDSSKPEVQQAVLARGTYPSGTDLETVIGADHWQQLQPALKRVGLPPDEARQMKPWLLASALTVLAQTAAGYVPDLGVDGALLRVASANRRTVVELERFADQAAVLDEMSDKHGRAWLARVSAQVVSGKAKENIEQTVDAWRAGDLEQMQKLIEAETAGDDAATEIGTRIARSRGAVIARRVAEVFAEGKRTTFAVHFANLAGPDGVMARLAADGFRVRQLTLGSEIETSPAGAAPAVGRDASKPASGEAPASGAAK